MSIKRVTYTDLAQRLTASGTAMQPPFVLDVREPEEWEEEHLACATLIPMGSIPSEQAQIPSGEVWIHCHSGGRAERIAEFLDYYRSDLSIHVVKQNLDAARAAGLDIIVGP